MSEAHHEKIRETVRKERKGLLSFIRQKVRTDEDAEDIVQDVFYQLTRNYALLDQIDKMTSWLFTVARNRITDSYRKRKTSSLEDLTIPSDDEFTEGPEASSLFLDTSGLPDDQYTRNLVWEVLEDSLVELPANQREVFVLHELDGLSFKDISKQTGVPVNTLISRKRYAVLHLREKLQFLYEEIINE